MSLLAPRESEFFARIALRLHRIADEMRANPRSGCQIDRRIDGYASAIETDLALVSVPQSGTKRS